MWSGMSEFTRRVSIGGGVGIVVGVVVLLTFVSRGDSLHIFLSKLTLFLLCVWAGMLLFALRGFFPPRIKPVLREDPSGYKVFMFYDHKSVRDVIAPTGEVYKEAPQAYARKLHPTNLPEGYEWWPTKQQTIRTNDLPIERLRAGSVFFFLPGQTPQQPPQAMERTKQGQLLMLPAPHHFTAEQRAEGRPTPPPPPKSDVQKTIDEIYGKK